MSRSLAEVFAQTRADGRAALIGYLPAGFPTPEHSIELITDMVAAGVDIVEVGLPYSDPLMDGPDIQAAVDMALRAGTTPDTVLEIVEAVAATDAAVLVMSYWNPIERYGVERFADRLADAGGCGVITPDLTPEEAGPWTRRDASTRPRPGLPGRAVLDGRPDRDHLRGDLRLRLRRVDDGRDRGAQPGQLGGPRARPTHARADGPADLGRARRLDRRAGSRGGAVRRRGDRGLGLRPPDPPGGRPRTRPGRPSASWPASSPAESAGEPEGNREGH